MSCANVVDLGCGNGRLLSFLETSGWQGEYLGVDSSPELLAIAAAQPSERGQIAGRFAHAELVIVDADQRASLVNGPGRGRWDAVAMFAVLHHIPGADNRARLVGACADLLQPGGMLVASTWQFRDSPRLNVRIQSWERAGIRPEEVEPDDYLLPWGKGAAGQRYCAAIDEIALRRIAEAAGLLCAETFSSDGQEGNLGLYGIFRKPPAVATSSR